MYKTNHNNIDLVGRSNDSIIADMGKYLKMYRLRNNKTQEELATDSGIKRETIARIENGANFNIGTFIQLLRYVEGLNELLNMIKPYDPISPSIYMKMQKRKRIRVKHSKKELIKSEAIKLKHF